MAIFSWLVKRGWRPLRGRIGVSPRWGSSWIDLFAPIDFRRGDRIRLTLEGSARKILVRFLPEGGDPNQPVGIVTTPFEVPPGQTVEFALTEDRRAITQISVHGGPNPWGSFPLERGNGPVTLRSVARVEG